jgi:hypothetical protein
VFWTTLVIMMRDRSLRCVVRRGVGFVLVVGDSLKKNTLHPVNNSFSPVQYIIELSFIECTAVQSGINYCHGFTSI